MLITSCSSYVWFHLTASYHETHTKRGAQITKSSSNISSKPSDLISLLTQCFILARAALLSPYFLKTLFLKDFPNKSESGAVRRKSCPSKLFSRRPESAHNIANNCLDSVSLSSHSLCVSVCLMSWFGCPLKRSFQSGYFGPHFDSLAVCLHPVVYHPLQQLPACVCACLYVCVCTVFLFVHKYCAFHNKLSLLYTVCCSICKMGLLSLETEVNHKEEPLAVSQRNNLQSADVFQLCSSCWSVQYTAVSSWVH